MPEAERLEQEPRFKVWRTVTDDKTRDSHVLANGQVRFVGEPFRVGDAALSEPRDPDGPPEETYNCRCTKEEYTLSDLPKELLPQVEGRLNDQQRLLLSGVRVAQVGGLLPRPPGVEGTQKLIQKINAAEAKLNAGGVINDLTPFEALVHFIMGKGTSITVSIDQVSKGIDVIREDTENKLLKELSKIKVGGQFSTTFPVQITGISITVDSDLFGSVEFDFSGSIFPTKAGWRVIGDVSAQTDPYDFNRADRPFLKELIVTIARNAGKVLNAKKYDIHFHGSKKVTVKGTWNEIP